MSYKVMSLSRHLSKIPDPRDIRGKHHLLLDILIIAILAKISGMEGWEDVEDFAKEEVAWLCTFLDLPNGIPSHDTFNRVFQKLDPKPFGEAFLAWIDDIREKIPGDVIAIDGKTLRSSMAEGQSALHLVSAWSEANHLVLAQRAVNEKSNEITAIPELLKVLQIKECIVTIDAMGCQKEIAKAITKKKADYVLAVKSNQKRLHHNIRDAFAKLDANPLLPHFSWASKESGHGRQENRKVATLNALDHLPDNILFAWAKCESITRVQAIIVRGGKTIMEERFYISTLLPNQAEVIGRSVRSHWGIENRLHWVLDVAFREDANRTRTGNAPECSAIARHIALNLFRRDSNPAKKSIRRRMLKAALNPSYRLTALLGFPPGHHIEEKKTRRKSWVSIKDREFTISPVLLGEVPIDKL